MSPRSPLREAPDGRKERQSGQCTWTAVTQFVSGSPWVGSTAETRFSSSEPERTAAAGYADVLAATRH